MLLTRLIDRLNAINTELIQKLETQYRYVQQLQTLMDAIGGVVADVRADSNNLFHFAISVPADWHYRPAALDKLLVEYGYTGLGTYSHKTGMYYTCHRDTLDGLAILIAEPKRAAA